jgi:SAM-dependent methyltransferase
MRFFSGPCPVCGGEEFLTNSVLWPELINAWQLSADEAAYIDRQQGFHCKKCSNNLRAMGLAAAIMDELAFTGTFYELCTSGLLLRVLEINRAGNLTSYLQHLPRHMLVEYPDFDMQELNMASGSYDLIIHSDTLEHISNPVRGLAECHRVLKSGGKCIFTIPIIVDRMSRNRAGLSHSYHGRSAVQESDLVVHTEFGVDFWKTVIDAGFSRCELYSFEYPAALVVIARKS